MADLVFRLLRADETDAAAAIHRRARETIPCFDAPIHTPEDDRAFYRDTVFSECAILGAFEDGELLGHIAHKPGWIEHLYVDPPRHSQGIGQALLERVKAGASDLQLWTFQANAGARRFYERHAFVAEEFTDGANNEEKQPDVRYRWRRPSDG